MKSWKTTLFGLMAGIGGGITGAYLVKPDLLAHFPAWLPGLGVLLTSIGTTCLGLAARDNNVTSEQAGAAPSQPGPSRSAGTVAALLLAGALLLPLSLGFSGCQATPARVAYNTASAPALTVDAAMRAWGDYVAQFHPPARTELAVKAAFENYQHAELLAIDAAQAYAELSASGSTNRLGARLQAETTSQTAAHALTDLVNLLQFLGVKL